jgi:hypothetical protein
VAEGRLASLLKLATWAMLAVFVLLTLPVYSRLLSERLGRVSLVAVGVLMVLSLASARVARAWGSALLWPSPRAFVLGVASAAVALSAWVVVAPLNGQVLALDSSVYLMEARALSHLHLGTAPAAPALYSSARFLFEGPDGALYGVFPPGYPLFLMPFVLLGKPMLAGPVTAALLVAAQYWLGREATGDELATRAAVVLSLPSWARAIETADLLSHAFVAVASSVAVAAALRLLRAPSGPSKMKLAAVVGAAVGWVFCARLLDGLVLGAIAGGIAAYGVARGRAPARSLAVAALAALPFVALLAAHQRAATGTWLRPTQSEFFLRSDYPATCHRLGFGQDVGCSVEHTQERASFGPDGYGPDDAFRVATERAVVLCHDLAGFAPLLLLGLVAAARRRTPGDAICAAFVIGLTLAYSLFYYGNAPAFGARHLFPVAPFAYLLMGRFVTSLPWGSGPQDAARQQGGVALGLLLAGTLLQLLRWRQAAADVDTHQAWRLDLAAVVHGAPAGSIVVTDDLFGFIAALDPLRDGPGKVLVLDDWAGVVEVRRAHPGKRVLLVKRGGVLEEPRELPPLPPALSFELDLAWPSFQRPAGLATKRIEPSSALSLPASGNHALGIFVAQPGGAIDLPFDVTAPGRYALRLEGYVGPAFGRYDVLVDGDFLQSWEGGAPTYATHTGEPSAPRFLAGGRHVLTLRCTGHDPRSLGFLAAFDRLIAEPAGP